MKNKNIYQLKNHKTFLNYEPYDRSSMRIYTRPITKGALLLFNYKFRITNMVSQETFFTNTDRAIFLILVTRKFFNTEFLNYSGK